MKKDKIVIFGAGGHGKVVLDILIESGMTILGFIDDDKAKIGQKIRGFNVLGDFAYFEKKKSVTLVLGIGNNVIREKIFNKAKNMGIGITSAVHPKAIVSKDVKLGEGVVIIPGAVINSGTVLEDGVVINTGASVDHDCYLGRFSQVWPGAHLAGSVRVGEFSYIGTGAAVIQNINIGKVISIINLLSTVKNSAEKNFLFTNKNPSKPTRKICGGFGYKTTFIKIFYIEFSSCGKVILISNIYSGNFD